MALEITQDPNVGTTSAAAAWLDDDSDEEYTLGVSWTYLCGDHVWQNWIWRNGVWLVWVLGPATHAWVDPMTLPSNWQFPVPPLLLLPTGPWTNTSGNPQDAGFSRDESDDSDGEWWV
jgi:hypothetical protein